MPATPARIGFIQQEFRRAVSETAAMRTRYGALARETDDPVPTYFDNEADAQVIADARQALLGTERRRFKVVTKDIEGVLALGFTGDIPVARFVDGNLTLDRTRDRKEIDQAMLISEIMVDLGKNSATLTLWG